MPVSTRSRSQNLANNEELRTQTSHVDAPHRLSAMDEEPSLNNQRYDRNMLASRDVPISDIGTPSSVPPQTLLQQQMEGPELRELVIQLSENQSSILAILQSLTETHSGGNLNSLQRCLIKIIIKTV